MGDGRGIHRVPFELKGSVTAHLDYQQCDVSNLPGRARPVVRLLIPDMPAADDVLPWMRQMAQNHWYSNFGPLCIEFESRLVESFSNPRSLALTTVASGTAGLELAMEALQLPLGSGVLLPSLSFPATASAVLRAGLRPVFCDVDPGTCLMTPHIARQQIALTKDTQVAAVIPVATFGRPHDVRGWDAFTADTKLPVVIDAASAFGSQEVGDTTTAVFSFHATKPFAIGEGGAVVSRDSSLIWRIRQSSNFGFNDGLVEFPGTNAKLSEYHAAVGLAAISRWPEQIRRRQILTEYYYSRLADLDDCLRLLPQPVGWNPSLMVIRVHCGLNKRLLSKLLRCGVQTRRWYWPPLHEHPAFASTSISGNMVNTSIVSKELLGLPFHLQLSKSNIDQVCDALTEVLR